MNQAHLHMLTNHLPILGSILGAFVLTYGLLVKSDQTKIAAYLLFIISTIGATITYFTGEAAEEAVEHLPGVSENVISQHEDFAIISFVALIILTAVSFIALFLTIRKSKASSAFAIIILLISLVSFGLAARTGYLGGQIRHTELRGTTPVQSSE